MNDIGIIMLGGRRGGFAIVDAEDFERINRRSWSAQADGYAHAGTTRNMKPIHFLMHGEVLNAPEGFEVDHINGYPLDNTRRNLRLCSHSQNICHFTRLSRRNTSGINGVSWNKTCRKWDVRIHANGRQICLGLFETLEEAARVRREAAQRYHGEFASTV